MAGTEAVETHRVTEADLPAPDVSIVVTIFNEAASVDELYRRTIAALDPGPRTFELIFVDDGSWGDGRPGTPAIAGRRAIPFLECNGMYYGRPANDESAISEFERLRSELQPAFLIIIWPAFWWMDYYAAFAEHVRETFPCLISNERMIAFDLTSRLVNGG